MENLKNEKAQTNIENDREENNINMDRAKNIYGNEIKISVYKKSCLAKKKLAKKYGDDEKATLYTSISDNEHIGKLLGVKDIYVGKVAPEKIYGQAIDKEKGLIVGNIRMGFGHYRISMAIASAANHMGYTPYWMDLNGFPDTTSTKVISEQNKMYSLGSRLSKNPIFNKLVWEPLNYEGFRALSYNSGDQKRAELMAPVYRDIPKDIPVVGTHCWPAQAAIHAGMKYVVNAVPDNWPMALHLSEGSVHTVQCHYAYQGYRILNGMNKNKVNKEMPKDALVYTGHYIDHELVANIEADCKARIDRKNRCEPIRFLLTIGGAGAQKEIFAAIIKYLLPYIKNEEAVLYINVGDYKNVWYELLKEIPDMKNFSTEHFDNWEDTCEFAQGALGNAIACGEQVSGGQGKDEGKTESGGGQTEVKGIHGFYHSNIFEAVYCTNLLMRSCDVLVTKPSELAFYPVPKLFIKRVGKHEMWGAIHSCEIGDGTLECRDIPHTLQMIKMFLKDHEFLIDMCNNIMKNKEAGIYDGAYKVVELAMGMRK